jgi:spermidine/putrescine transport system permease protein
MRGGWALPLWFWLFVAYLFLPLGVMALMGFRDSNFVAFPIQTWTSRWYTGVLGDGDMLAAIWLSARVAVWSTLLSLAIGLPTGLLVARTRGALRALLIASVVLPAFLPVIVSSVALRMYLGVIGLEPGVAAISFGHAVGSVPFVVRITLPFLAPALIGAFLFCILLSFEDFARSFFLGGFEPTFPVLLFARLRFGFDPGLAAVSTLVLVVSIAIGLVAERYVRAKGVRP